MSDSRLLRTVCTKLTCAHAEREKQSTILLAIDLQTYKNDQDITMRPAACCCCCCCRLGSNERGKKGDEGNVCSRFNSVTHTHKHTHAHPADAGVWKILREISLMVKTPSHSNLSRDAIDRCCCYTERREMRWSESSSGTRIRLQY